MARLSFLALATLAVAMNVAAAESDRTVSLAGRWQYLQPPDTEGEVLDLSEASGHWRGIMNGLERAGEHGLFYYVVEVESLRVEQDGSVGFVVGERSLFSRRPALSMLAGKGDAGNDTNRMRFAGRIEAGDLVLRCADPWGSCPDSTLRFKRISQEGTPSAMAKDTTGFKVAVRFSITDTTAIYERRLGRTLRIRVTREPPLGWVVSVITNSAKSDQPNLLYHSRRWHGPYPTDVFAWSRQNRTFPDERLLPVYGHPYELRLRLLDCRTSGTGDDAVFEDGTIEVAWRRAKTQPLEGEE